MSIQWVGQRHTQGCAVAAYAMLAGLTYEEALSRFPARDWNTHGLDYLSFDDFLSRQGFYLSRRFKFNGLLWDGKDTARKGEYPDSEWPPAPFAAVHLAQVRIGENSHFVVVDIDGTVFDPLTIIPATLRDYTAVNWLAGAVRSI